MRHYTQLTQEQRDPIYGCRQAGLNQSETAVQLRVNQSTISRELRRHCGRRPRRRPRPGARRGAPRSHAPRIGAGEWRRVDRLIQQEWSPVEIRGRLAQEGQRPISHEWIDQHVYRDQQAGGTWYRSLRCQRQRRKRYGCPERAA